MTRLFPKNPRCLALCCALLAIPSAPAAACSVVQGYRVPTNVELLEQADLVVLAKVVSGPNSPDSLRFASGFEPGIVLKPIREIKGHGPRTLRVFGYLKMRNGQPFASIPTPLGSPHPSTMMGACIRQGYAKGTLVLAMFKRTDAGFRQLTYPFARAVEDVATPSSLWVRAAESYVKLLADFKPDERRRAFEAERARLSASPDQDAQAIAQDISDYLTETASN